MSQYGERLSNNHHNNRNNNANNKNRNNKFHITSHGSLRRSVRPTLNKKKGNSKEKTQDPRKEWNSSCNNKLDSASLPSVGSAKLKELKHNYEAARSAQYNEWSKRDIKNNDKNDCNRRTEKERDNEVEAPMSFRQSLRRL